ncbi:MAG: ECF transporter S component, partial [Oscillospiraceae bacterium]|nr:ECF transporter S component [Oscillospiraceae bacterium]
IVNTGIFLLGCRLFFYDTVQAWGAGLSFENTFVYMIVGLVGINFLIELGVNLVLNPAILQIIKIGKKKLKK